MQCLFLKNCYTLIIQGPNEDSWKTSSPHWITVTDLSILCDRKAVGPNSIEYGVKLIRTFAAIINEKSFLERVKDDTLEKVQGGGVCVVSYGSSGPPLKRMKSEQFISRDSSKPQNHRFSYDQFNFIPDQSSVADSIDDPFCPEYVLRFHYIDGSNYGGVDPSIGSYIDFGCSNPHDHAALVNALQASIDRARVLANIRLGKMVVHANELLRVAPSVATMSPNLGSVLTACGDITVTVSQLCRMSYGDAEQTVIGVPSGCTHYRWLYPTASLNSTHSPELDQTDPDVLLLCGGGFLYYNKDGEVIGAMALSPHRTQFTLLFSEPEALNIEDAKRYQTFLFAHMSFSYLSLNFSKTVHNFVHNYIQTTPVGPVETHYSECTSSKWRHVFRIYLAIRAAEYEKIFSIRLLCIFISGPIKCCGRSSGPFFCCYYGYLKVLCMSFISKARFM